MDQLISSFDLRNGLLLAALAVALAATPAVGAWAMPRAGHFTLANGMEVVVISDHRAPVVTHMVWYRVGAADEAPGQSGVAHFLEHLMFKGTDEIPSGQFSRIVARNGGQDNAFTSHDATAYFQRVAKDRLPLVMKMEADRMRNLKLDEKEVATERMVVLEERRSRVDNDPSSILQEQMMAALYQSHPYGVPVIGWEHEIADLSRDEAIGFYKQFYGPANAILVVAGDVTLDEVKTLAGDTYGKIEANGQLATRQRPKEPRHYAQIRVKLEDARAGRAVIQRYYLAPSSSSGAPGEAEAIELLMKIVGDGSTSRLYRKLVMEGQMASSAGGSYSGTGLDSSRIGVYAVADDKTAVDKVEKGIDEVLDDVRINGVTQVELDRARNSLLADYVYASDSQSRLARLFGWALANGRTLQDVESLPERLGKVTVEDVQRAAERYLVLDQSVTGLLLPVEAKSTKPGEASPQNKT